MLLFLGKIYNLSYHLGTQYLRPIICLHKLSSENWDLLYPVAQHTFDYSESGRVDSLVLFTLVCIYKMLQKWLTVTVSR